MLSNLSIRNIVLITSLDIVMEKGLCVLTGETGAGKSILLDALGLALGDRLSPGLLRHGCEQGQVSITWEQVTPLVTDILEEQGIACEDALLIRRTLYADGRSKAFVNDTPVSLGLLKQLAERLIEIHGQHDQSGLLDAKTHLKMLDAYGQHQPMREQVRQSYRQWQEKAKELSALQQAKAEAAREEDYLRHIVSELEKLNPQPQEEEALAGQRRMLMQREKLAGALSEAEEALSAQPNVETRLRASQQALIRSQAEGREVEEAIETLERAIIEVMEAASQLERLSHWGEDAEGNLDQVEERLFALRAAARKHHVSVEELPAYKQKMEERLSLISGQEVRLSQLEQETRKAFSVYKEQAATLSKARHGVAKKLEKAMMEELVPLKMGGVQFAVSLTPLEEGQESSTGLDKAQFMASTNPGQPLAPIAKIASGGELSRFMLALKVVLQSVDSVPTLIFDEVDTGIGGAVADAVGRRLEALGKHSQILVVTHQPQVAARGNYHLKVSKQEGITQVVPLSEADRKEELARMLSGASITEAAREAASSLLSMQEA